MDGKALLVSSLLEVAMLPWTAYFPSVDFPFLICTVRELVYIMDPVCQWVSAILLRLLVCVCECTFLMGRESIASIRLAKGSGTQNRLIIFVLIFEISPSFCNGIRLKM